MNSTNKKQKYSLLIFLFIAIEASLYILYMYIDINISYGDGQISLHLLDSSTIKYYSIILCLAVSVFFYFKSETKSKAFPALAAAMLLTAVSDYFLLLKPKYMQYGLVSFCLVHAVYLYVIKNGNIKKTVTAVAIRIAIAAPVSFILFYANVIRFPNDSFMPAVVFLVLLYGISFIDNIFRQSANIIRKDKEEYCLFSRPGLFLAGLVLFLLCDINVMIFNLGNFFDILSGFYLKMQDFSAILMWTFYLPSQVLIVLSCIHTSSVSK